MTDREAADMLRGPHLWVQQTSTRAYLLSDNKERIHLQLDGVRRRLFGEGPAEGWVDLVDLAQIVDAWRGQPEPGYKLGMSGENFLVEVAHPLVYPIKRGGGSFYQVWLNIKAVERILSDIHAKQDTGTAPGSPCE